MGKKKMSLQKASLLSEEFDRIPFGERVLLWMTRVWIETSLSGANPYTFLIHGLKLAKAVSIIPPFDSTMTILSGSSALIKGFPHPNCPMVSVGEQHFLAAVAAIQQKQNYAEAESFLACWLSPVEIESIRYPLDELATSLASNKLLIRPRYGTKLLSSHDKSSINNESTSYVLH